MAVKTIFENFLALRARETVLILSDGSKPELCRQLFTMSQKFDAVATVMQIKDVLDENKNNFYQKFMGIPSVIISVMEQPLPDRWKKDIQKSQNTRVVDVRAFDKKAQTIIIQTPSHRVNAISQKIKDILSIGQQMKITSACGTDFQIPLTNIQPRMNCCPIANSGDFGELPAGKLAFNVKPGAGDGVLLVNGRIEPLNVVSELVRLKLTSGVIRRISGKKGAAELQYLFKRKGAVSRHLLAIGFGTNEAVKTDTDTGYEAFAVGNFFFTFGIPENGDARSQCIMRAVLKQPTVVVDGKMLLDKGYFLMAFHPVKTAGTQRIYADGKNF